MRFDQTLHKTIFYKLQTLAKQRGIDVQEYIRAVVIPEFLQNHPNLVSQKRSKAIKKSWEIRRANQASKKLAEKNEEFPPYPAGPQQ